MSKQQHTIANIWLPVFLAVTSVLITLPPATSADSTPETRYGYTDTPLLPGSPWHVHDPARPQPPIVVPGSFSAPTSQPSDAIVLFDGKDLSQWRGIKTAGPAPWKIEDGVLVSTTEDIETTNTFGDCQLHLEWATPAKPDGGPMVWGNSGVYLLGLYEVQIIQTDIYADGITGAIYGQTPPLVRAMRPAGEWQSFDILFSAPRFQGGKLVAPAYVTVFLNGVLVQNHQAALGPTRHRELASYENQAVRGPLLLQYHGSSVRFRNIWLRAVPMDDNP